VVHAVGPVDEHLDGAAFERGIQVGSAARAVAIPVAECTPAMILPATKGVPTAAREDHQWRRADPNPVRWHPAIADHRRTVGPVGASRTGRRVQDPPRPLGLEVLLGDPFVTADETTAPGRPVSRSRSPSATWSRRTPVADPVDYDALSASA
jgi:phosphoglycerate dehydrogenase-like enzyme